MLDCLRRSCLTLVGNECATYAGAYTSGSGFVFIHCFHPLLSEKVLSSPDLTCANFKALLEHLRGRHPRCLEKRTAILV
jgi:hypothetical protein